MFYYLLQYNTISCYTYYYWSLLTSLVPRSIDVVIEGIVPFRGRSRDGGTVSDSYPSIMYSHLSLLMTPHSMTTTTVEFTLIERKRLHYSRKIGLCHL